MTVTPPRRWLVLGAGGMLGIDLVEHLRQRGNDVTASTRDDLDIRDLDEAIDRVAGHDVVVNCAAWTKVDAAESEESAAFDINATGAANVARACDRHGARLVHISTDYVFAGDAARPYAENDPMNPRSAYGRTKAAGEWAVRCYSPEAIILRVAWLYGQHGGNFVKTMARLADEQDMVSVVGDQFGQPTWTVDVCQRIAALIDADAAGGPWHATSSGTTSWAILAQSVFEALGHDPGRVKAITTAEYPLPAPRPAFSALGHHRWEEAGLGTPKDWSTSLEQALPSVLGAVA